MATIRENFFAELDAGARWSVPVAINRNNPLPLDDNSVFRSEADLDTYLAGPLAYPGQIIALVEADKTTIFYIDQEKQKQEVGASLSADGKTVVINNGNITLANMPTDTTKTYNATLVNGVLTWTEPSATTVEGLDTRLTAAEGQIVTLNQQVAELGKAFEFKGTAGSISDDGKTIYDADGAAITGVSIGDVYQIGEKEYAYNGEVWVELGFNVDLSGYATDEELEAVDTKATNAGTAATNAQTSANEAKTAADNAQTAAEAAQDTADQAVEDAAAASELAQTGVNNAATAQAAAEAAQSTANTAKDNAATNATAIGSLQTLVNGQGEKITALETAKGDHETRIGNLETTVASHTGSLTSLQELVNGKASQSDLTALTTRVATAEGTIADHTGAIAAAQKKADDAYTLAGEKATMAEVEAKGYAVASEVTTALEGKADKSTTYTKTEVDNIAILKADQTALEAEAKRAKEAEAANAKSIADLTAAIDNVTNIMNFRGVVEATDAGFEEDIKVITDVKDGDVILYKEQEYVYNNGIWVLFGDASGNAAAITALTTRVEANETAVQTTLPGAIAQTLTDAKAYTDQQITALGMANYTVKSVVSGHEALTVNNVDGVVTIGFADEIILNGGSAN